MRLYLAENPHGIRTKMEEPLKNLLFSMVWRCVKWFKSGCRLWKEEVHRSTSFFARGQQGSTSGYLTK